MYWACTHLIGWDVTISPRGKMHDLICIGQTLIQEHWLDFFNIDALINYFISHVWNRPCCLVFMILDDKDEKEEQFIRFAFKKKGRAICLNSRTRQGYIDKISSLNFNCIIANFVTDFFFIPIIFFFSFKLVLLGCITTK